MEKIVLYKFNKQLDFMFNIQINLGSKQRSMHLLTLKSDIHSYICKKPSSALQAVYGKNVL